MRVKFISNEDVHFNTDYFDSFASGFAFDNDILNVSISVPSGNYTVLPGFCDVHVHFREPGFSYKESFETGTQSAAKGGYTDVCMMPNLSPVPDSVEHLKAELECIKNGNGIGCHPYASLTVNEDGMIPSDIEDLAPFVIAFSDDGKGIQSSKMMKELMKRVRDCGKIIAAHCEDNSLLRGGYIHEGNYAEIHGHSGICSESEWRPIARDLELSASTGCPYHVCHISCKESVSLIRQAKKSGVNVTCETAPHYLVFSDNDLMEDGRFKMNPPLRGEEDRNALIEGVKDGTIDMIATDHAPHSIEEKSRGLKGSAFGVVGLETAFPSLYTYLVHRGIITIDSLINLMVYNPRKRFNINSPLSFSIWNLESLERVNPDLFLTKGRATPFEGLILQGINYLTYVNNKIVYKRG